MSDIKYVTKEQFDESIKALEKKIKKTNAPPRAPREPNNYNKFMKEYMVTVKKENPGISNTDAFKKCASEWNNQKKTQSEKEKSKD